MTYVIRSHRKVDDNDLARLNSVGLSLATISKLLGCHPTTVTLRLRNMGIQPADTRRSFMEDIFVTLSPDQQEWLADQLTPELSVKDYVRQLLVDDYYSHNPRKVKP